MSIILGNALWVVDYFENIINDQALELRQRIEHEFFSIYIRLCNLPNDIEKALKSQSEALNAAIFRFRDKANADPQFVIYKTLIGFQSIFPGAWERKRYDYQADDAYRRSRIDALVDEIDGEKADFWLAMVKQCARTEANDLATFPNFGRFLQKLGARKPNIILKYINQLDEVLSDFLPMMLIGLSDSSAGEEALRLVRGWLSERRHIFAIMRYLRHVTKAESQMLDEAITIALETADYGALLEAIHVVNVHHGQIEGGLIDRMLLPAIKRMSADAKTRWVEEVGLLTSQGSLFTDLTAEQADVILDALAQLNKIDYHGEAVLAAISPRWPEKILDFFGQRLERPEKIGDDFEAIPHDFYESNLFDDAAAASVIERAYHWYENDKDLFSYRGGRLIAALFPKFSDHLTDALVSVVNSDRVERMEFVLSYQRPSRLTRGRFPSFS